MESVIVRDNEELYTQLVLKAVIFDFDGVIVDSEPLHYRAFLRVAHKFDIDFSYKQYLERYVGYDDRDGFRTMINDWRPDLTAKQQDPTWLADLCQEKAHAFESIVGDGFESIQGTQQFIESINGKLPMAIASGAVESDISLILGQLRLADCFDAIITANDVTRSKPDPRTYELAVEKLAQNHPTQAIEASDCVAIEDTPAGLESARRAGLSTVGLTTTYPKAKLKLANRVLETLEELTIDLLRKWFD